jgi:hypothetical protein
LLGKLLVVNTNVRATAEEALEAGFVRLWRKIDYPAIEFKELDGQIPKNQLLVILYTRIRMFTQ